MTRPRKRPKSVIGWREWIELPELCPSPIKVKIDTGARTSALHAFGLRVDEVDGVEHARFEVHPEQRSDRGATAVTWPVGGYRQVRSSSGVTQLRPVIATRARLGDVEWEIEVTLTSRDPMGFRMLLGRVAVRRHFIVNAARSYLVSSAAPEEEAQSR